MEPVTVSRMLSGTTRTLSATRIRFVDLVMKVRSTIPTHHLNALRVSTPPANWKHIIMDALETPLVSLTKDCLARDLVFANVTVASHTTLRGSCAIEFGLGVILVRKLTHVASAYFV